MVLSRPATQTEVRLNGAVRDDLHVLTVQMSAGAQRLDNAVLEVFRVPRGTPAFTDQDLIAFDQAECEISAVTYDGRKQVIHWGQIAARHLKLDEQGESVQLVSRLEPHHFGQPLTGIRVRTTRPTSITLGGVEIPIPRLPIPGGDIFEFPYELVWNPEYDGRVVGNARKSLTLAGMAFVLPEELLLEGTDETARLDDAEYWTLRTAALYLCRFLNGAQTFVQNPTLLELAVLPNDPRMLRNHRQPLGKYLPEQLDTLLNPYGYEWCVEYVNHDVRKIRIYRRGAGLPATVLLQPPGASLDMERSNAEALDLTADVSSRLANELRVLGDFVEIETTQELVPAWDEDDDEAADDDLVMEAEAWKTKPRLARVKRDWVLNEGGDYNGRRESITRPKDLFKILGLHITRRRKLLPMITILPDGGALGQTRGVLIEWWDDFEGKWRPAADLDTTIKILERECGVRFTGKEPPHQLYLAGIEKAKVRVTATIQADLRVEAVARAGAASPLAAVNHETIVVGSRYKLRRIDKTSQFHRRPGLRNGEQDDRPAAQHLAAQLLAAWNQAQVSGTVTITGCGWRVAQVLGRTLTAVSGRNLGLRTTHPRTVPRLSPSIVGITFNFQRETIDFVLDTYRAEAGGLG